MKRPLFLLSLFLSGLMAILCLYGYQKYSRREADEQSEGKFVTGTGIVRDISERDDASQSVTISNLKFKTGSVIKSPDFITNFILRNPKILCECEKETELRIGQEITFEGTYHCFRRARNPGEFDLGKYFFSKGYLFALKDAELRLDTSKYSPPGQLLYVFKRSIGKALSECLDEENAGIMTAMLLGDRTGLSSEVKEKYNETGIAHVLAISGLHISILGAFLSLLLERVPMKPFVRAICLAVFLICYAYMAGLGVSVIRATVCFLLRKLALLFGRSADTLTNLSVASIVTVCICPAMLLSSSYLLSYLAVIGLTLLSEDFEERKFGLKHPVLNRLLSGFAISFITLPVIMNSYYSVPVYSIPLNLLILPFMPYLFGCGGGMLVFYYLSKTGVGIFPWLCRICAFFVQSILNVFRLLNAVSLSLPHGRIVTGMRPFWRVAVFFLVIALAAVFVRQIRKRIYLGYLKTEIAFKLDKKELIKERLCLKKQENRVNLFIAGMILCLAIFLFLPCRKEFRVTFLDVGQGDGIIIEDGKSTYVIDGGSSSKNELGKYVLIPALEYRGIDKVDGWFVTHPDKDHISGLLDVIKEGEVEIGCIYVPSCMEEELRERAEDVWRKSTSAASVRIQVHGKENEVIIKGLYEGERLSDGRLSFIVLSPPVEGVSEDSNENSLVLLMEKNGFQFLFMGDAGEAAERRIMEEWSRKDGDESDKGADARFEKNQTEGREQKLDIDVLKVGHHGSAVNANGEEFLSLIKPRVAVISCGINNRYGHPHEETLERLEEIGAYIYRTDESGAVTVKIKRKQIVIEEYVE